MKSSPFRLLLPLVLAAGCSRAAPAPSSAPPEADFAPRASYPRTLAIPEGCGWPLELEQLVCAVEHEIDAPTLERARRTCAERHRRPLRQQLEAYSKSFTRLEEIRAQRSKPLAMGPRPPGLGPDPTRNPEEPLGDRGANEREAKRDQRAEMKRLDEEVVVRRVNASAESKLSELFRYVEPCLDARIPFESAPRPEVLLSPL